MALVYKIRKCFAMNKKAGRGYETGSSSFFVATLPYLCLDFANLWVKFSPTPVCYS